MVGQHNAVVFTVQGICRKVSEQTARRHVQMSAEVMVKRLNRMLSSWANYYDLGQVSPVYRSIDEYTTKRLRRWLCCKHKVRTGEFVHFLNKRLWTNYGLIRLGPKA